MRTSAGPRVQARHKTTKATTIRAGTSFGIRSRGRGARSLLARHILDTTTRASGRLMGSAAAAPSGTLAFVDAGSITQSPAIKHVYTSFGKKYPKIHVNVAEYSGIETTFDTDVKTR